MKKSIKYKDNTKILRFIYLYLFLNVTHNLLFSFVVMHHTCTPMIYAYIPSLLNIVCSAQYAILRNKVHIQKTTLPTIYILYQTFVRTCLCSYTDMKVCSFSFCMSV